MAMVDVDDSCLSADLQTKSIGLVWGLAMFYIRLILKESQHQAIEKRRCEQWTVLQDW